MCSPCLVVEEVHCQAWCNTASTSISSNLASPGCIQPIKKEKASGFKGGLGGFTKMTVSLTSDKIDIPTICTPSKEVKKSKVPADNSTVTQKCMLNTCKNTCKIFSILPKKKTGCIHCVCMFEKCAIRTVFFPHWMFVFLQSGTTPGCEVVDGMHGKDMQSCREHLLQV